jgi:hypothetical protein
VVDTGDRFGAGDYPRRIEPRRLRTPRSAGYAGILFSVLITISLVTIRLAVPAKPSEAGPWLSDPTRRHLVQVALALMPFAGVAFLWFVGVVRDRIGEAEDRFFSTLFLGSGLVFIALLMAAEAVASALIADLPDGDLRAVSPGWTTGRHIVGEFMLGGLQMAGVFTTAAATILLRTGRWPRSLAIVGFVISAILMVAMYAFAWASLLFPLWVFAVSLVTLRNVDA